MYVYLHMYIYIYINLYYILMCTWMLKTHKQMYIYIYICLSLSIYIFWLLYKSIFGFDVCIYIYIYVYMFSGCELLRRPPHVGNGMVSGLQVRSRLPQRNGLWVHVLAHAPPLWRVWGRYRVWGTRRAVWCMMQASHGVGSAVAALAVSRATDMSTNRLAPLAV